MFMFSAHFFLFVPDEIWIYRNKLWSETLVFKLAELENLMVHHLIDSSQSMVESTLSLDEVAVTAVRTLVARK